MKIFTENLETISRQNKLFDESNVTFRTGINQFTDMTFKEFSRANEVTIEESPDNIPFNPTTFDVKNIDNIPISFDWREFGVVGKVKDQKDCGSCYAIAALDSVESQLFIKTGKSFALSVQEVVDCAGDYDTWGCDGGISFRVFDYIKDNGGISLADSYFYHGISGACDRSKHQKILIDFKGFGEVPVHDEELLKHALFKVGPIVVSIDIDHEFFMRYSNGIYNEPECSSKANHAALLVGYGNENKNDFWIIKNSFGEKWGEEGYMRIVRNSGSQCAFTSEMFYPLIN